MEKIGDVPQFPSLPSGVLLAFSSASTGGQTQQAEGGDGEGGGFGDRDEVHLVDPHEVALVVIGEDGLEPKPQVLPDGTGVRDGRGRHRFGLPVRGVRLAGARSGRRADRPREQVRYRSRGCVVRRVEQRPGQVIVAFPPVGAGVGEAKVVAVAQRDRVRAGVLAVGLVRVDRLGLCAGRRPGAIGGAESGGLRAGFGIGALGVLGRDGITVPNGPKLSGKEWCINE